MIALPFYLNKTLPRLESYSQFFTACYCCITWFLNLSNWIITTTLHNDTSTARSVRSIAFIITSHRETESMPLEAQSTQQERCPNPINLTPGPKHTGIHTLTLDFVQARFCRDVRVLSRTLYRPRNQYSNSHIGSLKLETFLYENI